MIKSLSEQNDKWDIVIIGGGATGAGTAVDAASRGYKTLLLEQNDFGKGTSSRSTKLVHGGVRYLEQGNFSLVLEALKERGILYANAKHLVRNLSFVVPNYDWWEGTFYGVGLKLYDMMAGKYGFGDSKKLSKQETLGLIPTLETKGLRGGVIYFDGQFDDARLLINLIQTASEYGATVVNYFKVQDLLKSDGLINGVVALNLENGKTYTIKSKVVINATGAFSDSIRQIEDPDANDIIAPSRGTHIVLDRSFLPGKSAIMVPHTSDGRILFAIPWHKKVIVGTTDIAVNKVELEPKADEEEIDFLLEHTSKYLTKDPTHKDILSVFSGIRPLVKSGDSRNSSAISREHTINISRGGLLTIAGGKWTTYRKMAEDTVDEAIVLGQLGPKKSITENLRIHGWTEDERDFNYFGIYGSDAEFVQTMCNQYNMYKLLHPSLPIHEGEVLWAVKNEMARTVEDFLSRRTRALLLDAKASIEIAPKVSAIMAAELNRDDLWIKEQIRNYTELAQNYLPKNL